MRLSPHANLIPAMPSRWIKQAGILRGVMRRLEVIDASYRVLGSDSFEIPVDDLIAPYPLFAVHHAQYELPPSQNFLHEWKCSNCYLNIAECNFSQRMGFGGISTIVHGPWREKAHGRLCLALPIWLYCDDTSGNKSKKWNKHNSILMSLAGLLSSHSNLPFEIHFISMSNLAPPTEMFEGLSNEIRCVAYDFYIINYALVGLFYHTGGFKQMVLQCLTVLREQRSCSSPGSMHFRATILWQVKQLLTLDWTVYFFAVCVKHAALTFKMLWKLIVFWMMRSSLCRCGLVIACKVSDWQHWIHVSRKEYYAQKMTHWDSCAFNLILHYCHQLLNRSNFEMHLAWVL